ncbi:TerD family protein [Deinococcus soli (ex Cha et al. 2016)]|uniref:Tellurium resistance protein TerD n=2 Tax=Deinococcus soli (ex Cha et al. 2016) TaxID=1309411 RepID=A0AAE3XCY1_9DEIO|nr:TerD family protein [Deinococcus soli (ex Cha et al. 2016)]MDR6218364.1 tellurium resistance protein TerD [Deinococcus soli (ex Cha et al. 2016)]MDR6329104.1 tellurium resistance protein TerD [Deinococcus soli (ex Cha et al. 2016)]MDR6751377.1 tellurium resistance protein TerD [Deinococcus soli (ex Cha et al. 2016)]
MTVITLQKGGNLSLTKSEPGLTKILVGLSWDPRSTDGRQFDLDASAFRLNASGKVPDSSNFIYYGQLEAKDGSIIHTGDNRDGQGDGDDEQLKVDLSKIPPEIEKIAFTVTIYEAQERGQNFGQVSNPAIRIVNELTGREIVRFDLGEDFSTETAVIFAELYRYSGEWKFRAVAQGYAGGLRALCAAYGVQVG